MTYLTCTLIDGGTLEHFEAVAAQLPANHPDAPLARYAGSDQGTFVIVAVFASKVSADRYGTEVLEPVLRQTTRPEEATGRMVGFEVVDEVRAGQAVAS